MSDLGVSVPAVNVGDLLRRRALRDPLAPALVDTETGERLTYRELNDRANRVAHAFRAAGLQAGDRVAILLPNGADFVSTYYGLAKAGAIAVLLNWRLVAEELDFLLADSGATHLIFHQDFAGVAKDLLDRASNSAKVGWYLGDATARPAGARDLEDEIVSALTSDPELWTGGQDVLCLCYSSGTTGTPKGAMLTHHGQFIAALNYSLSCQDYTFGARYLLVLPLFHLGGIGPMHVSIMQGTTLVIMKAFDPERAWAVISSERVTAGLLVPVMLNSMLAIHDPARHDHSSVVNLWVAAAPVPVTLLEQCQAKGIGVLQTYGLTESGGPGTILGASDAARKVGSAGRPYYLTDVQISRPDGSRCEVGEAGEVLVRAEHVMAGYWNNPEATAAAITDGWLHTGDIAIEDHEGFVTIQDRLKDMIISGGENVYPAELENVILSHPGVREVAVIAQSSVRWGESPFAVVVASDDTLTTADVADWCNGKLARFKQPKGAAFVAAIPRNASGKALKRILREQFPGPAPE
jgi:acyl-CoA synthetase (AMP-forming)/AMP-acid ligase II